MTTSTQARMPAPATFHRPRFPGMAPHRESSAGHTGPASGSAPGAAPRLRASAWADGSGM